MGNLVVTPLGTISPYPKGKHNCPGFLVESGKQKVLLDCGNGITSLLNFPEDLKNLQVILTHLHKDHIGDIGCLQYASYTHHNLGELEERVKIYLPKKDFQFSKRNITEASESYTTYQDIEEKTISVGDMEITFYDNHSHPIESYLVKIKTQEGQIVYTSDIGTTNLEGVIKFCEDSDLLICESSFLERHHSASKSHLTSLDAARIAKLSKSKRLVLTHFWPQEKKEEYVEEARRIFENTIAAEEGQKIYVRRYL